MNNFDSSERIKVLEERTARMMEVDKNHQTTLMIVVGFGVLAILVNLRNTRTIARNQISLASGQGALARNQIDLGQAILSVTAQVQKLSHPHRQ